MYDYFGIVEIDIVSLESILSLTEARMTDVWRALLERARSIDWKRVQIDFLSTECQTISNYAILVRLCDLLEINSVSKNCWIELKCWEWEAQNIWKNQIDNRNMNGTRSLPKHNHYNVSKDLKRKQVSAKCSKGSESNTPSAPKKPKKAKSTPQQNSNSRSAS